MDDELQQLEAELKALRPVAPSRELRSRIAAELTAPAEAEEKPRPFWWGWIVLPAVTASAAALALVFLMSRQTALPPISPTVAATEPARAEQLVFKPVSAENVLLAAKDEGLVTLADGSVARRVRQSYIDTIVWKDPRGQASLRWSVPREEERVVPIVFQ